jgi:hypothetical protein
MYINIIHYKTPLITLVLKYICNFSYFVTYLFEHKYISYVQVCKCLLDFIFK